MESISIDPCADFQDFIKVRGLKWWQYHYLCYLFSLKEDRAAMATLRRGLGLETEKVNRLPMARYIYGVMQVPSHGITPREEEAAFVIASLFAAYVRNDQPLKAHLARWGDMGDHFFVLWNGQAKDSPQRQSIERRFDLLLATHPEELALQLRKTLSFFRSQSEQVIPIQWARLLHDFIHWGEEMEQGEHQEPVRYRWAKSFWGRVGASSKGSQSQDES